jgi:RNA recognition motif-containing protein
MASKLFVGSLPYNTTSDDLQTLFAQFGNIVSTAVITDRDSGRSKGFGFVEFENDDDAKAAVKALDGSDLEGRRIIVNEARPKEDRPRNGGGGGFQSRYDNNR